MRNAFAQEITALAEADPRLVLLMGDIGNRLFDRFKVVASNRFFNCGVAEQNMIGMAAGLASCGFRPICYTITPFVTTRCLEQIRVDVCYHRMPVTIVGTGAGLSYASLGATHHSCEDLAMLRVLPEMTVLAPADSMEVRACLRLALRQGGPVYMRIGKKGEPVIHAEVPEIEVGKCIVMRPGERIALLSAGNMLPTALAVAESLGSSGFRPEVASFPTIKPLDTSYLSDVFRRCSIVATIEEHSVLGGFGGSIAEWRCDQTNPGARLVRFGTGDEFLHVAGEQEFARSHFGLTTGIIAQELLRHLEGERPALKPEPVSALAHFSEQG
ncbi:MAG: transketolase [Verrucomicrobia bacterium]|nr:transketolase [Verrucomicrobiota bacterium]